mgnify:FL=1|jgi:hypothetical protein
MGLDMYLNAKRFLWSAEDSLVDRLSNEFPELDGAKIRSITAEVGYWRKANAIHKWFVDNVQEGTDDCGTYEVSNEKLKELLDLITKVLANKNQAPKLLPNTSGFFFGSMDYDKYYFEDLEYTKTLIEKLIKNEEKMRGWYLEYHSSW